MVETRKSQINLINSSLKCLPLFLFLLLSSHAQEKKFYFYKPISYGSDATFNPFSMLVNGGFDELQAYWRPNSFAELPWKGGSSNVWANITSPLPQISKYGWKDFFTHEVFPTSLSAEKAQYFPNYTLHLIGGGMAYRKAAEWFDYYGYPVPYFLAAVTAMGYHYINEIIENGESFFYSNVDPIADLLIFDPLGIILFSFDGVCDFFSTKVELFDWNSQPAFSFLPFAIRNTRQSFVIRYPISKSNRTSIIYHFGAFGELGLSYKTNNEDAISVTGGLTSKQVYTIENPYTGAVRPAIKFGPRVGVYWDRNNSLMMSLVLTDNFKEFFYFDVYPGVVSVGSVSPGFFILVGKKAQITLGVTFSFLPIGLSAYIPR